MNYSTVRFGRVGIAAAALAFSLAIGPAVRAQEVAWAWVQPQGQPQGAGVTFTPPASWQFSTAGDPITVTRGSTSNRFIVKIPGAAPSLGGCVHATAWGGNHTAVVRSWNSSTGDVFANIDLYDPAGNPKADGAFTVHWRHGGPASRREAYLWANEPLLPSYSPSSTYSWNGNRGGPLIVRQGTGVYQVSLPGLGTLQPERGNVQVSPHGSQPVRASVSLWSSQSSLLFATVRCFDMAGNPTDARFVFSYQERAAAIWEWAGSGAHVWADQESASFYTPDPAYTDSNGLNGPKGSETIERLGLGHYRVHLPDLAHAQSSTVQVTAEGTGPEHATIKRWVTDGCGGTFVEIETWDPAGQPADARFSMLYLTDRVAAKQIVAWAWVAPAEQPQVFTPAPNYQYSTTGQTITVEKLNTAHVYRVTIPDVLPYFGGNIQVSAHNGNHTAQFGGMSHVGDDVRLHVFLFDENGHPAPDQNFTVMFRKSLDVNAREAFVWASAETAASYYATGPNYTWNGRRGDPLITRSATGTYQVRLPGLAPAGSERGHVQVTADNATPTRVKVTGWNTSGFDTVINVICTDMDGNPKDSEFMLHYQEVASPIHPTQGSGSHVWANHPTLPSYTPHADYTDSNGKLGPLNAETIDRLAVGRYRVNLPNVAAIQSTHAQVTSFGADDTYATIDYWNGNGPHGTQVLVEVWDKDGNPKDGRFNLLYLTDDAAVEPATNTSIGSGCNGPALVGLTRPVLCRDWHLGLTGIPQAAVLGFMQLDFGNSGFPLGTSAPGCTIYTNGAVTVLLVPPIELPTYTLTIPSSSDFIGLPIYAQGGALVPGINPYSLALSNGVLGEVGDS